MQVRWAKASLPRLNAASPGSSAWEGLPAQALQAEMIFAEPISREATATFLRPTIRATEQAGTAALRDPAKARTSPRPPRRLRPFIHPAAAQVLPPGTRARAKLRDCLSNAP